jgi:Xaa-Pro dipeptidase
MYQARVKRIFKECPKDVGAIVLMGGPPVRYCSGTAEAIAVLKRNSIHLAVHKMSEQGALDTGLPAHVFKKGEHGKLIRKLVGAAHKVGVLDDQLSHNSRRSLANDLRGKKLVDVSKAIMEASYIKDDHEVKLLRRVSKIASDVADEIPSMLKEGMTELELLREINYSMASKGAEGGTFGGIVAFGAHSSYPHWGTGHKRLKKGDWVLCDYGASIDGYGSDITRTMVFGKASARQKKMYATCHDAHLLSFDMTRDGKDVIDINKAVDDLLQGAGYGPFIHSIGHALGVIGGGFINRPGAVNTVEPGIYLPGYGGVRIEDDILIKEGGKFELLTKNRRDALIEV